MCRECVRVGRGSCGGAVGVGVGGSVRSELVVHELAEVVVGRSRVSAGGRHLTNGYGGRGRA